MNVSVLRDFQAGRNRLVFRLQLDRRRRAPPSRSAPRNPSRDRPAGRAAIRPRRNAPAAPRASPPSPASARSSSRPAASPRSRSLRSSARRESRREVEIDQRRRFVAGEDRAHARELFMNSRKAWRGTPAFSRQERDLDQVLDHHAEHDVVGDLADARELAFADIGDAAAARSCRDRASPRRRRSPARRRRMTACRP